MNYLGNKLNISLENAELFAVLELVQAPNVGEISRRGYVEGWKSIGYVEGILAAKNRRLQVFFVFGIPSLLPLPLRSRDGGRC